MKKSIQVYFQTVSHESAKIGDFAETGDHDLIDCTPDKYDLEDNLTAVDLALKELKKQGYLEASSSQFHTDVWYTTIDSDTDYKTGDQTNYTFHLVGFNETEQKEIFNKLMNKG